ncbi:GNAT family N-acetyltransferase [Lichenihabitans psoromatis]|uniref:GNAT family N-acetyltransferase n=1 Tax=Lichenihabitans psoromatis TaxID=2528642 RepID=UPI0010385430|nr:GNAT family N-acetyltransferase [Lichenihabitans psoromatis]
MSDVDRTEPAPAAAPRLRCRLIVEADLPAVAALLTAGFPDRTHAYWTAGLTRMARRDSPPDLPRFGYVLDRDGDLVGVILLISGTTRAGDAFVTRSNLSSWYVDPAFQGYASILISQATKHKQSTYFNVSPAEHTRPIIEAQGFIRYSQGRLFALPAFARRRPSVRVEAVNGPRKGLDARDVAILEEQRHYGCLNLAAIDGEAVYPFSFRLRTVKGVVPAAQLVYCRDIADMVRFAGPIGRALARRGRGVVVIDANRPIAGIPGAFVAGGMPKYFKGPDRPRDGDLSNSEIVVFGL